MKIGVGTYIVREQAQADLRGVLRKLAAIGYAGVELLGFFGREPGEIRGMLDEFGIRALGNHVSVTDFLDAPRRALDDHLAVGCAHITLGCSEQCISQTPFDALAEAFARAAALSHAAGIAPLYHNHAYDMRGESPFAARLLDAVPALGFEPDVGWMTVAGQDAASYLLRYAGRAPVIHLKDVFVTPEGFSFRPTGYGNVNTPALLPAIAACKSAWLVVDHDLAYERDSFEDLALSLRYVKSLLRVSGF